MDVINGFNDYYEFLSNFYECPVVYGGLEYGSSEAAYQSMKTSSDEERYEFTKMSPAESKRNGRNLVLREDWESIRDEVMFQVVLCKFMQNDTIRRLLLNTGSIPLFEGNTWHDNYWGICSCEDCKGIEGRNMFGKTLMVIRDMIRHNYTDAVRLNDMFKRTVRVMGGKV